MKPVYALTIALLLTVVWPAPAQSPDEQYVGIFNTIQQADAAFASGQAQTAVAGYLEAQTALRKLQSVYPDWNASIVKFRLEYITGKLAAAAKLPAAPVLEAPGTRPAPKPAEPDAELLNELKGLREQVGHLQADKHLLEAKLKEALAAQPAALDPRELAKAEERIRTLEKEADLLKVTLEQERARKSEVGDSAALDRLKQELTEAKRQLSEQANIARALAQEKAVLQKQLDQKSAAAQTDLAQARERIATLEKDTESLRSALDQERAKQPATADAAAVDRLRQKLAEADRKASEQGDLAQSLAREKAALENRAKAPPAAPGPTVAATSPPADAERLAQLIKERDELQVKLNQALRDLVRGKTEAEAQAQETANQLAALRARIEILEARPIPYSPEELALMKPPSPRLAATPIEAGRSSPAAPPAAGSATLIAEAHRQFAARQYDKAEENYLQALRQDDRNSVTLANLAVTQMQLGKLDDAEARARQAVTVAPDDAFSHMVLGQVKMRQEKYDDAVDALSRAAQLNPQSAEVQNYLGIALSHKGLRLPAETALRKAIMLEPGYGSAHNNLAVIYLNQNPPMVALARWHYQKALAAGAQKNPELEKALEEKGASAARP